MDRFESRMRDLFLKLVRDLEHADHQGYAMSCNLPCLDLEIWNHPLQSWGAPVGLSGLNDFCAAQPQPIPLPQYSLWHTLAVDGSALRVRAVMGTGARSALHTDANSEPGYKKYMTHGRR
ncbi:hypothetical protein BS47DRAFT_1362899 [Hydnum rufescens UP504]|uniref:Uncharacterized protein n=1 Tax=Hydnum rufescens UP504 TaxID=1448309 RepID=A0A9P6AVI2_9AGAM|nr:hypothetical protein BS47DRAFT_1362899 [Hydnum rufescens UP504]